MNAEQRMAGDYKIFLSLHVDDKEIVVGEDPKGVN